MGRASITILIGMWTVRCEPFNGAVISVNGSDVAIPLGAKGEEIASQLRDICGDVSAEKQIIYALENSLQLHLRNDLVDAIEIALKHGPSAVYCLGRDYVHDLGNDIIADLEAASSGDILFGDVFIDCGIAIWRPADPNELAQEYEELLSDDSWQDEFDTLSEFEGYYREEIHDAQQLSAVLIGTAAYFESYREIQQ